jgi:Methyltransferase domain
MNDGFLSRYLGAFRDIPGWFSPDAYLIFMAYHQLLAAEGLLGDVLEIGVHHGLSAIGLAALRGDGHRFVAVDLFDELQSQNVSGSGLGNRASFIRNIGQFYDDLSFLTTITHHSAALRPEDLGSEFSFCHIDGGHSAAETRADLELSAAICMPGGLIAVDDYFNPAFPGVGEAAVTFNVERPGALRPIAIGFNKVLFQKEPSPFDLNERFARTFPHVRSSGVTLWGTPVRLFDAAFSAFFDCSRSTPQQLVPAEGVTVGARLEPAKPCVTACAGETVSIPVHVTNLSRIPLARGSSPFGLSYHLLTADHGLLRFDHAREWFTDPLSPGASRVVEVPIRVPDEPGCYEVEFDIVWEGVSWMKDLGNPTALVELTAIAARDEMKPAPGLSRAD